MKFLTIHGSYGEGGGQILRSTLALSILTGKPVRIVNIRAGRDKPGLRPQHLTGVQAGAALSDATVTGAEVNSLTLTFQPHRLKSGHFHFDIGTAGAVTLVLQALLPPLCWASRECRLTLKGGTHVPWSPSFHYLDRVFLPMVRPMGLSAEMTLRRAGWYPKGGGEITGKISPVSKAGLSPRTLTQRGALRRVTVYALSSNLPNHIAQRECQQAVGRLRTSLAFEPDLKILPLPAIGQGTMVMVVGEFEQTRVGFSAMGKIGKRAERVADEAIDQFLEFDRSDATVDRHLADQLLLYLALAEGTSQMATNSLTEHVRTNIWLIEQFLPVKFQIEGELGATAIITVEGCGYRGKTELT
ncbi:MAG: RNA 3'-terminal phosphate cyclase [Leptolyngbyaceae cyanobacterium MO_188.B28]|nr:RNA 3'-terminal phosphate cyclase [Leptolyngbyaceae cyanobacterium MO_188.B28]